VADSTLHHFYVYVLFRPNGIPCYVGKGSGNRWQRQSRYPHSSHLRHIVRQAGGELPVVLVREGVSEREAYLTETALIAVLGLERDGGLLVNHGLGGEGGPHGVRHSDEQKAKRSADAKAMWADPEKRAQIIAKQQGNRNSKKPHTLTPEWRQKLTEKMKGNTATLGMRFPGKALFSEHRAKLSASRRAKARQLWLF